MTPSIHEVIENSVDEATRDICSVAVSAAQKSKVREILLISHLSLLDAVVAMTEEMKSKNGGGDDYDDIENKDYNAALSDLRGLLAEEIEKLK